MGALENDLIEAELQQQQQQQAHGVNASASASANASAAVRAGAGSYMLARPVRDADGKFRMQLLACDNHDPLQHADYKVRA